MVVAGSMREAFGVQTDLRYSGIIENDGLPTRGKVKNTEHVNPELSTSKPAPADVTRDEGVNTKEDREFALASASLRQALQNMPEIAELSKNIMFEETKQGLNLEIMDQDGRPMFADGSKVPFERTRLLLQRLAVPLRATPLRVSIVGHTSTGLITERSDYNGWDLSSDRANSVRQIFSGTRGAAGVAHLRGDRQIRQPAAVCRRSFDLRQPPGDHHPDARKPGAAAGAEALRLPNPPLYR